jgi:hypothetical protein
MRLQLDRLLNVQLDRLRLKLRAGTYRLAAVLLLCAVVLTATVAAIWNLIAGLTGALTVAFNGRAWLGNITGGLLVLVLVGFFGGVVRWWHQRREMKKLVRKYEPREVRR